MITYTLRPGEKVRLEEVAQGMQEQTLYIVAPAGVSAQVIDSAKIAAASITLLLMQDARVVFRGELVLQDAEQLQRSITLQCEGAGSDAALEVSCQTKDTSHFTLTTFQNHTASHGQSSVRIMGVSGGASRATVASTIFIAPRIGGVAAHQVHKHLLLDNGARAVSVPALDILSGDVSCSHGSAITHLDATQLFYLQARGYGPQEARDAMVKAFLQG